ncbi:MAG: hypothetical protein ACD_22C00018G0002 [uncultured bacterium]|nr:MAG: hypothetical protein ACD_22C00018G0002 [uncultured bacterium]
MFQDKYQSKKTLSYEEYKKIGEVFCPQLKSNVKFNSYGFWHIVYRSGGKKRDVNAQMMRFKLLPKAVELLGLTTTLQEYDSFTKELPANNHGVKTHVITRVEYFGYIGIIESWKIKVIVKKIGNGEPFFWSVIPNWVTSKKRDVKNSYKNSKGNLEED